jgi:Asp-tRNA(Asn)/Glu-tRNA(Gln) amidotransferase A subunit family amidase
MSALLTIAEAARRIAAKQLSPVELVKTHLDRIRRLDPGLNAFLLVTEERALTDARAAEARQMSGALRGRLDGIPIAHKDIYNTAGIRTTAHSKLLEHNVPTRDAHTVKKWADAGTVMLGKLATHEFAFGGPSFDLPWPPARNPWNRDHFTAGSSSGTGAAVAAGLILGGTGSDTGGSIRGPAALCGIAGLKPTYGLSSRTGILPLAFSLDHAGPMAWTAEDCGLLLQGMAGHDPEDPASIDRPVPDFTTELGKGVKGLRIGVVRHFFEADHRASDATRAGIDAAMDFYAKEGAEVRDIALSPAADYHAVGYLIMITEAFTLHGPWMRKHFMDYGELFRDRISLAATVSGPDMIQATRRRRMLCSEMAAAMENLDIIVSASQPGEAARIDSVPKWANMEKPSFTMPFNVTGFPAISICTGFGEGGLPVAMQLAGKPFTEPTLLRAAHAYEIAMPWRARRPAMAG